MRRTYLGIPRGRDGARIAFTARREKHGLVTPNQRRTQIVPPRWVATQNRDACVARPALGSAKDCALRLAGAAFGSATRLRGYPETGSLLLLLSLLALLISGCGTGPARPDEDQLAAAKAARADMDAGNYQSAAGQFRKLAEESSGELADRYRLEAAEAYFQADDQTQTRQLLERLEFKAEEQPQLFVRERLLEARLALAGGETELALERLQDAYPAEEQPLLRGEYHLLRARANEQQDKQLAAVAERLAADHALRDQTQRLEHVDALWKRLQQLERAELNQLREGASASAAGWIELAQIESAGLTNPAVLRRTLDDWQLQYPDHPGVETVLPELRAFIENMGQLPQQIALILPFSSAYGEAARIIRDGFMGGWYQGDEKRPKVRVYDTGQADIVSVYNRAVADGAELIVGPLQKDALTRLVDQGGISVPTLALNQYEGDNKAIRAINQGHRLPLLYQFSLAPEDEARQIAERAWFDGHAHALALTPTNDWGNRVFNAFRDRFEELGGKVLERVSYTPTEQEFSGAVQALLNIDNSIQRHKELRAQLQRSLKGEPRRRQDADFIMVAGYSAAGRQIGPQLLYHRADDLPVYATSHIYDGVSNSSTDADLNGFIFADMPWLLDSAQQNTPMYREIEQHWPDRLDSNPRLYAFGIDAYRILSQLSRMTVDRGARFEGVTGRLTVGPDGHIQRQLSWAKFVNGSPRPLDNASMVRR